MPPVQFPVFRNIFKPLFHQGYFYGKITQTKLNERSICTKRSAAQTCLWHISHESRDTHLHRETGVLADLVFSSKALVNARRKDKQSPKIAGHVIVRVYRPTTFGCTDAMATPR